MGKSRLVYEFRRSLAGERVTYLEGRCLSFGASIPYLPWLDIVRANCGITPTDGAQEVAEKARFGLEEVGMDGREGDSLPPAPPGRARGHRRAGGPEPGGDQGADLRDRPPACPERQPQAADHLRRRGPSLDRLHLGGAGRLAGREPLRRPDPAPVHLPPRVPAAVDRPLVLDPALAAPALRCRRLERGALRARRGDGRGLRRAHDPRPRRGQPVLPGGARARGRRARRPRRRTWRCRTRSRACSWRASTAWRRSRDACSRPPRCSAGSSPCGCSARSGRARARWSRTCWTSSGRSSSTSGRGRASRSTSSSTPSPRTWPTTAC